MFGIIWAIVRTLVTALGSRRDLLLENLALQQQLVLAPLTVDQAATAS